MNNTFCRFLAVLILCSLCLAPAVQAGASATGEAPVASVSAPREANEQKESEAAKTPGEKNLDLLNKISPKPGPSDSRKTICGGGGC